MAQFRELTNSYRLEKILSSGRSATVLKAVELATGRAAAVKLINLSDPAGLTAGSARLNQLAETIRGLGHPGLPSLLDWGFTTEGSAFLAMELLPGARLESLEGAPPDHTLPLLITAVEAVAALAGAGLSHLNLSPENLWVVPAEGTGQNGIRLLGLGTPLFRAPDPQADAGFRAPEVVAGGPGDARSDVYSLARTFCQVLGATVDRSGARPSVQLPLALSFDLANAEVVRRILERSLEAAPESRPSLGEMRSALRLALGFTEPAFQESAAEPAPAPVPEPAAAMLPGLQDLDVTALDLSLPGFADGPRARVTPPLPVFEAAAPLAGPAPDFGLDFTEGDLPPLPPLPPPALEAPAPPVTPAAPPPLERSAVFPPSPPAPAVSAAPTGSAAAVPAPSPPPPAAVAAPPPAVAAPPPPAPPEPDGEVLRSIDDELASVLAAPLPAAAPPAARGSQPPRTPAPAAPAAAVPGAGGAPAPAVPARRILGLPKMVFLGGIAALILLAFALVVWWLLWRGVVPPSTAEVAPPPRSEPAIEPPTEKVQEVVGAAAQGDDYRAWRVLASITPAELQVLPAESRQSLTAAEETLARNAAEKLAADLPRGLASGNLDELRGLAAAASRVAPTLPPDAQEALGKINSALALYGRAQEAMAANRPEEALDHFAAVLAAVPALSDPEGLRDRAADALLAKAEPLARQGSYEQALAQLEPLRRAWPDRPGVADLVARYESAAALAPEQEALLASLPNFERRRKPHEGLRAIGDTKPVPHLEQRFAEARTRLENQLRQLDGKPPQVVLRDGYSLLYSRGTVANLSFRVSDDYEVVSVRMFAAPEGGKMRNVPLEKARGGSWYSTEIRPDFHRNGTVRFYVTATDLSGQEGSLGSAAQPLELKRAGADGFR